MARNDLKVVGLAQTLPRRIAAAVTRYEVGEPCHRTDTTYSSGVASANTWVLAAADTPVIGTHIFGGVFSSQCVPFQTGTVVAHTAQAVLPLPGIGLLRGRAETIASVDTDAELLLIINDVTLIDYNATGAADGGQLYTIKEVASADTSGLEIVGGNPATSTLDVVVDVRCFRIDIS